MSEPETNQVDQMHLVPSQQAVDYKILKAGDATPDGMIFVGIYTDKETGKQKALLRTEFNRMSHYDAEAKAEAEKHLDRRLPMLDELDIIRLAMTEEEIRALGSTFDTFAWSGRDARIIDTYGARGMYLADGGRDVLSKDDRSYVCLVRSVDL